MAHMMRVRQDELLRLGLSLPTATAIATAGNAVQTIIINQGDFQRLIDQLTLSQQQLLEATESLQQQNASVQKLETAVRELQESMPLPQNIKPLDQRITDLENRNP